MARRKRTYISREQKEEITKELIQANCNIKLLAEKYQVTVRTLSKWRNDYYVSVNLSALIKDLKTLDRCYMVGLTADLA